MNKKQKPKFQRVKHDNLSPWPRVRHRGNDFRIGFRVMTPLRLSFIQEAIFAPLVSIWKACMVVFVLSAAAAYLNWFNFFAYLPFSEITFLTVMAVLLAIWIIERFCGHPLCRVLFGRYVSIRINNKEVSTRAGLLNLKESVSRDQPIMFVHLPFEKSDTPIYRRSEFLTMIVGNTRKETITEAYNVRHLEKIVNNINVALHLQSLEPELDIGETADGSQTRLDAFKQQVVQIFMSWKQFFQKKPPSNP